VTFTPTDTANYSTASASVTMVVNKATPVITWKSPAAVVYGTPLGATQLNATASVPGNFTYCPPAGTVLAAGTQTLIVTFTPVDSTDYATVTAASIVVVKPAPTTTALSLTSPVAVGSQDAATFIVTVGSASGQVPTGTVTANAGTKTACSAVLNGTGVGTCTLSASQLKAGTYVMRASYAASADFKASKSVAGSLTVLPQDAPELHRFRAKRQRWRPQRGCTRPEMEDQFRQPAQVGLP